MWVTVCALNCTLIQYFLSKQDYLSSLLDTTEKIMKTYTNKNPLYIHIIIQLSTCLSLFLSIQPPILLCIIYLPILLFLN